MRSDASRASIRRGTPRDGSAVASCRHTGSSAGSRAISRFAERTTRRLARSIVHAMVRFGPTLERRQMVLFRAVDIGAELFAMSAACVRAQMLVVERQPEAVTLADVFCREARGRIRRHFAELFEPDGRHALTPGTSGIGRTARVAGAGDRGNRAARSLDHRRQLGEPLRCGFEGLRFLAESEADVAARHGVVVIEARAGHGRDAAFARKPQCELGVRRVTQFAEIGEEIIRALGDR